MTGSLMFLIVKRRPEMAFGTSIINCYVKNLGYHPTNAVKTIMKYIKGSKQQEITYNRQEKLLIKEYSNFDWTKNLKSQKLKFGFIFIMAVW